MGQELRWADVLGYEGLYSVSNSGQIKSIARMASDGTHFVRERIRSLSKKKLGYKGSHLSLMLTGRLKNKTTLRYK